MGETENTYKDQFGNTHKIGADDEASNKLCILCNLDEKDTFENPDSMLCISCRENSIRYPTPKWLKAVIAIVTIILAFALFKTPTVMNDLAIVLCKFA